MLDQQTPAVPIRFARTESRGAVYSPTATRGPGSPGPTCTAPPWRPPTPHRRNSAIAGVGGSGVPPSRPAPLVPRQRPLPSAGPPPLPTARGPASARGGGGGGDGAVRMVVKTNPLRRTLSMPARLSPSRTDLPTVEVVGGYVSGASGGGASGGAVADTPASPARPCIDATAALAGRGGLDLHRGSYRLQGRAATPPAVAAPTPGSANTADSIGWASYDTMAAMPPPDVPATRTFREGELHRRQTLPPAVDAVATAMARPPIRPRSQSVAVRPRAGEPLVRASVWSASTSPSDPAMAVSTTPTTTAAGVAHSSSAPSCAPVQPPVASPRGRAPPDPNGFSPRPDPTLAARDGPTKGRPPTSARAADSATASPRPPPHRRRSSWAGTPPATTPRGPGGEQRFPGARHLDDEDGDGVHLPTLLRIAAGALTAVLTAYVVRRALRGGGRTSVPTTGRPAGSDGLHEAVGSSPAPPLAAARGGEGGKVSRVGAALRARAAGAVLPASVRESATPHQFALATVSHIRSLVILGLRTARPDTQKPAG